MRKIELMVSLLVVLFVTMGCEVQVRDYLVDETFDKGFVNEDYWTVVDGGAVEVQSGELYVKSENGTLSSLILNPLIPSENEIVFDVKPLSAEWNGYGITAVLRVDTIRLWYLEFQHVNINLYSQGNDGWEERERFPNVEFDVWYRISVVNKSDSADVKITVRDTGAVVGETTIPHVKMPPCQTSFQLCVADWEGAQGRVGAYLDNILVSVPKQD
ncbi:MAG: hypothetical protein PHV61_07805 [Limnochordia bacterium]|nr:hypothetical protein [Limnochordia bacterium]MDD4518675.1 hypothetical protein [Limnochordia bacterium]